MNQPKKLARKLTRAATTTTLVGVVLAVTAHPSSAAPESASAQIVDGVLVVNGTNHADQISLDFTGNNSAVAVNLGDGSTAHRFERSTFHAASVFLHAGDDDFRVLTGGSTLTDVPLSVYAGLGDDSVLGVAANDRLYGGSGTDVVLGGAGTDLVVGGRGDDQVNGGIGTDTEVLGSGDDIAAWNPGEGNDVVVGGSGSDTLAFNGSDGDERMSLTANGQDAVFLRNLGNIRMDLADVEGLDLATLGGADVVTIGDLTGTDIQVADLDLAASNGAGDQKNDTVVVNGTDRADQVAVTAHGGAVEVSGLSAEARITGGEPADHLQVDTAGGNDQVAVSNAADALLDIAFDLGAGQS